MMPESFPKRLLAVCVLLMSPVAALLLFLIGRLPIPIILLLYSTVVVEGVALGYWVLSNIHPEDSSALAKSADYRTDSTERYRYYLQKNRSEVLTSYIRSATQRKSPYFRQHSREQIAKVLEKIIEENTSLLQKDGMAISDGRPPSEREALLSLDLLLHPKELNKK